MTSFSATCCRFSQFLKEQHNAFSAPLQAGFRAVAPVMEKANLTIFYGGQMLVFQDFPAEKARDLMKMVGKVEENSAAPPPPTVVPAIVARGTRHLRRRACLNRFMEKRRERIHSSVLNAAVAHLYPSK